MDKIEVTKTTIGLINPKVLEEGSRIASALMEGGAAGWSTLIGKNVNYSVTASDYGKPAEVLKAEFGGEFALTEIKWDGDRSGRLFLLTPAPGAREVVAHMTALMLGGSANPAETKLDAEGMDAFSEAVNSFFGQAAQQARAELGGAIKLVVEGTKKTALADGTPASLFGAGDLLRFAIKTTVEGRPPFTLSLLMSPSVTGVRVEEDRPAGTTVKASAESLGIEPDRFATAMKVKLPLVVVIAAKKMRMELIQGMSPGTIIEFKKMSGEMLDVVAGNVKIAEAEVVITNQCFGIQIRSMVDARARTKS